jgi:uncharacterized membrane-anchored protein YjiN (DUF445 family)
MSKGDWTILASLGVAFAGLAAARTGMAGIGVACVYIGAAAFVGCATNRVAIRALFDPWPSRRWKLPYTGVLEREREEIEEAIVDAVGGGIITPEALAEGIRESQALAQLRDEAAGLLRRMGDTQAAGLLVELGFSAVRRAVENDRVMAGLSAEVRRLLEESLESDECYAMVRRNFRELAGPLGELGHATGVADYDEVTYRIIDALRAEAQGEWTSAIALRRAAEEWLTSTEHAISRDGDEPSALRRELAREFGRELESAAQRLEGWDVEADPFIRRLVEVLARELDVRAVVRRALAGLETEAVKQLVLKHSRRHLAWLEVWGGVLGAAGGALLWVASGLL